MVEIVLNIYFKEISLIMDDEKIYKNFICIFITLKIRKFKISRIHDILFCI